jgi:hypothetical protein
MDRLRTRVRPGAAVPRTALAFVLGGATETCMIELSITVGAFLLLDTWRAGGAESQLCFRS